MAGKIKYSKSYRNSLSDHYFAYDEGDDNKLTAYANIIKPEQYTGTHVRVDHDDPDTSSLVRFANDKIRKGSDSDPLHHAVGSHLSRQFKGSDEHPTVFTYASPQKGSTVVPFSESGLVTDDTVHSNSGGKYVGVRQAQENEQLQLFHAHTTPGEVFELYSRNNPAAKISAMTILGMADLDNRKESGKSLVPSKSLSHHSWDLVDKLYQAGAVADEHKTDAPSNSIGFSSAADSLDAMGFGDRHLDGMDITHQSRAARAHIRGILHPDKETKAPNNNPEGWRQPTLWED